MATAMLRIKSEPGRLFEPFLEQICKDADFVCFCGQDFPLACRNGGEFCSNPDLPLERGQDLQPPKSGFKPRKMQFACSTDCIPTTSHSLTGIRNSAMTAGMHHIRYHLPNTLVLMPNLPVAHIKSQVLAWTNMLVAPPCGVRFLRPTMQIQMLITCLCHGLVEIWDSSPMIPTFLNSPGWYANIYSPGNLLGAC